MTAGYPGSVPRLHAGSGLVDDALVTRATTDRPPGQPLRTAAIGGLAFTILYLLHRILQGTGPDGSTATAVAAYQAPHRGALLASEIAVALALLAFIPFVAGLVPVIWRAGQETLAVAVAISGGVFVAMGFVSNAAETALIGLADANQPAAVLALDQLQGRTPIVWTITALVAATSLAIWRTGLVGRWLGVAGLVAAAIFLVGSVFSVLGRTPEGGSSLVGVGLFIVWMLAVSVGLWRTTALGGVMASWLKAILTAAVVMVGLWALLVILAARLPSGLLKDLAGFLPACVTLARRLRADPRVPFKAKAAVVLAGLWVLSPVDLLPEFLPVIGPLDDVVVVALALRYAARRVPREVLLEAWPGEPRLLERLLGTRPTQPAEPEARGDEPGRI
jgi:uncharacterized membrane protein YkvA (DUF1232 family)